MSYNYTTLFLPIAGLHKSPQESFLFVNLDYLQPLCQLDNLINLIYLHIQGNQLSLTTANLIITTPSVVGISSSYDLKQQYESAFGFVNNALLVIVAIVK